MKSFIPYVFCLLASPVVAQGWQRTLAALLNPAAVCQTPDGGAAMLANSVPDGPQGRQIVLSKMDQDGRLQWQKSFGALGDDEGRSMVLTTDGNLAIAGKISFLPNNGDAFLALYHLNGQKIWERNYNFGVLDDAKCLRQMPDGGFAMAVEADNQLRLLRCDASGIELWSKTYPSTNGLLVKHLENRNDGGWVITLLRNSLPIGAPAAVVLQISPAGDLEFQSTIPHFSNFVTTDQVRCKPASDSTFWLIHRDSVYLLDRDTTMLRQWRIVSPPDLYLTDLLPADDGGLFVLGTQYSFNGAAFSRAYFARFRADGVETWRRFFDAPSSLHSTWAAERARDGGFFLSGNYAKNGQYFSYLLRTDSLGQAFSNQISGRVFWDKNDDCSESGGEPPLKVWMLRIELPNGEFHYANTDNTGAYTVQVGLGEHKVSVLLPNGLWSASCAQDVTVVFDAPFQSQALDFPIKNTAFCPLPRVDAGVDYWLQCTENTFFVHYANAGTALAENAAVTLQLDSLLTLTGASQAFSQIGPHSWRFPLGDLQPLADSSFWVKIQVGCGADVLGRTLCLEASIEPDQPCLSPITGPLLIAEGRCEGDSVRFHVFNLGLPMTESQPYIVVEDDIMFLPATGELQLGAGEEWILSLPANGSTWRFELLQNPGIPDWLSDPQVAAIVEGCSTTGGFSTGYVNQFSLYDGGYFDETECRTVVASAAGEEKVAYPAGWTVAHLIQPNTDLEYALHFQNLTGDSVLALTLRDTIDHLLLDPGSLLPGPASHPYQFDMSGLGVLNFRFMGIALTDSARVWVKFRVQQRADLSEGTVIRNRAWAYPDFDAPMRTNETFHTIGPALLVGNGGGPPMNARTFRVWPVPTSAGLTIELHEAGHYVCKITDLTGRLVLEKNFSEETLYLTESELPNGVLIATIFQNNLRVGQARVVKLNR